MQVLRRFASGSNIHHCQPFQPFFLVPDRILKWHRSIVLINIDGRDFENAVYDGSVESRLSLQHCIRPICTITVEDLLQTAVMHSERHLVQKQKVPKSHGDLNTVFVSENSNFSQFDKKYIDHYTNI